MYRFLLERRWLLGLLAAVVAALVAATLGAWQFERRTARHEANQLVQRNYDTPVRPLSEVLDAGEPVAEQDEWLPVRVRGRYDADRTVLARNRTLGGNPGYEVLVPLVTPQGPAVLVDRGWVPTGASGAVPADVPEPPPGEVTAVVRLRASEPPSDRGAPEGQVARIDVPAIAATLPYPVYPAYGVLAQEDPAPAVAPQRLPRPPDDEGPHLSYSLQWYLFAGVGFGLYAWLARREAVERAGGPPPEARRRRPNPRDDDAALEDAAVDAQATQLGVER